MAEKINVIAGLGDTGLSYARYLAARAQPFVVMDAKPAALQVDQLNRFAPGAAVGDFDRETMLRAEAVYVSPGVPLMQPDLLAAAEAGTPLVGDVALFGELAAAPVVAITGTNGKSTVASLLHLAAADQQAGVYLGGNIGTPCLDILREDASVYVLEVSSYQLELAQDLRAKVAVVLNLAPDHLDRYTSIDHYFNTKLAIYDHCEQAVINRAIGDRVGPLDGTTASFGWDSGDEPGHFHARSEGDGFVLMNGREVLMHSSDSPLSGRHNCLNLMAAFAAGWLLDLDLAGMAKSFGQFRGLPHRSQLIAEKKGIRYINDSKATNPGALVAAVSGQAMSRNIHLIAGGVSKGLSFDELESEIIDYVKAAYLIGEASAELAAALPSLATSKHIGLREAVYAAQQQAQPGDVILLAPGCASFDQFRNYAERGQTFVDVVAELSQ